MAIAFNQQKGSAQKSSIVSYQYTDGDNRFRLVGDILARYVYWAKLSGRSCESNFGMKPCLDSTHGILEAKLTLDETNSANILRKLTL